MIGREKPPNLGDDNTKPTMRGLGGMSAVGIINPSRAAFLLRPVHEHLLQTLRRSPKLFADETTTPVLDPGRGKTKTALSMEPFSWATPVLLRVGSMP